MKGRYDGRVRGSVIFILVSACASLPPTAPSDPISLRWLGESDGLSDYQALSGFQWALSDLGAVPVDAAIRWDSEGGRVEVDPAGLGVEWYALETLAEATAELAASGEAEANGGVDLGRWLTRTLYDPLRYYTITGACRQFSSWTQRLAGAAAFGVTESLSFDSDRLITFLPDPVTADDVRYAIGEGQGSLAEGTFVAEDYETVDILPNGQMRYAIYDGAGALAPLAASIPAGQPGKCMWCHEAGLMHAPEQLGTGVSWSLLEQTVRKGDDLIRAQRRSVGGPVDYENWVEVHEFAEALVEGFLHPAPARVAAEWGESEASVRALGLETHDVSEFGWTERYARADVDAVAPYSVVPVPADVRDAPPADDVVPERLGAGCPEESR